MTVDSEHGSDPKGKIKAKLVRNGKVWQTKVLTLRDGARKVTFAAGPRDQGDYTVRVKYVGARAGRAPAAVDAFTVEAELIVRLSHPWAE